MLVESLGELGAKLSDVGKVAGASEVNPTQVADALKPFSLMAKNLAESLNARAPSVSSVRKVANAAASAAATLAKQSAQMAEFAEQMRDVDAASKAVDDDKQRVDKLELEIKAICDAASSKCVELSGVLARFPAPTDQSEVADDVTAWTRKLNAWTSELSKVIIQDAELKSKVQAFAKNWHELGVAMLRLVTMLDLGKRYEALTKDFNLQIERTNKTIAEANALCAQ